MKLAWTPAYSETWLLKWALLGPTLRDLDWRDNDIGKPIGRALVLVWHLQTLGQEQEQGQCLQTQALNMALGNLALDLGRGHCAGSGVGACCGFELHLRLDHVFGNYMA